MKNYVRPEFYVEQFMPDEYISACEWVAGTTMTVTCEGMNEGLVITHIFGTGNGDGYGVRASNGSTGSLFIDLNENNNVDYGTTISFNDQSHTDNNTQSGEYKSSLGTVSPGETACDCDFGPNCNSYRHHHVSVSNVSNKNRS